MTKRLLSLILLLTMCLGVTATAFAASDAAVAAADKLYELGLFKGIGDNADGTPNYDLDRAPTRAEAVTLLVRLLGKEREAQYGSWTTPFTDVADWAKPYVGYAYANGLTSGTSATTFEGNVTVSATQYLTFILRALGYKDGADFEWNKAWELTDDLGITSGEYSASSAFLRGNAVLVSVKALDITLKDSGKTLFETIYENLTNSGKTFTCTGQAWPKEGSAYTAQPNGAKATVRVVSAYEAVFTLEYPYPISEVQDFIISFGKSTTTSAKIETHAFYFSYDKNGDKYSANGIYAFLNLEASIVESQDEDMSGVTFTDASAQDYKVTWRVNLPENCPFNFGMIGEYELECTVGVYLGGA